MMSCWEEVPVPMRISKLLFVCCVLRDGRDASVLSSIVHQFESSQGGARVKDGSRRLSHMVILSSVFQSFASLPKQRECPFP